MHLTDILIVCCTFILGGVQCNNPEPYPITNPVQHAEAPTWDGRKNILFYVDVHNSNIYSWNYNTCEVNKITLTRQTTAVVPAENNDNLLIVCVDRSILAVEWDGTNTMGKTKNLTIVSPEYPGSVINEAKADSKGRLWFGTKGDETPYFHDDQGIFYKMDRTDIKNPSIEIAPVNISNGFAWNAANDKLYYIDSNSYEVAAYNYDAEKGTISNRQVAFRLKDYNLPGIPDGMTIDEDDNIWVAVYGGGAVIKVDPRTGQLLQNICMPAKYVTSVMWGGPQLDILFVTTSRLLLTDEEIKETPLAGSVFALTNLQTRGRPVFNADIVDSA